jgi:hypothetical protein
MSAQRSLAIRSVIAVAVLTVASIVLIAGRAHDHRRAAVVVHAQSALSLATVRP